MQGATTDDEPMGRNPGTSEAANLTALKVRGCDLAARFADLVEASGHVPCFKAVHMNAPSTRVKSIEKLLAPRAVPHMRLIVLGNEPRHASGLRTSDTGQPLETDHPETAHLTATSSYEACAAFTRVAARTLARSPQTSYLPTKSRKEDIRQSGSLDFEIASPSSQLSAEVPPPEAEGLLARSVGMANCRHLGVRD